MDMFASTGRNQRRRLQFSSSDEDPDEPSALSTMDVSMVSEQGRDEGSERGEPEKRPTQTPPATSPTSSTSTSNVDVGASGSGNEADNYGLSYLDPLFAFCEVVESCGSSSKSFIVRCRTCSARIKFQATSKSNLKTHLSRKHPTKVQVFCDLVLSEKQNLKSKVRETRNAEGSRSSQTRVVDFFGSSNQKSLLPRKAAPSKERCIELVCDIIFWLSTNAVLCVINVRYTFLYGIS